MENIGMQHSEIMNFEKIIEYSTHGITSKQIIKKSSGNVTLFSFDKGQGLSEHTAPFDALVNVIEGEALVIIDKKEYLLKSGEAIIMPANVPHALSAPEQFKMLLTMIKI
ncbi:MAG: cupin domain-containing protein [Bacteroidales bacterium]|nr:cupin domain-containing protein [Bacteroidales bacterium]MDZ4203729.1 cupin domain-containing protein [Bacteroidales bacterium]